MEDGSAQAVESIIDRSIQFGFFQKRIYLSTGLLQAATVSVLAFACLAQPEPTPEDPCLFSNVSDIVSTNGIFLHSVNSSNASHNEVPCSENKDLLTLTLHVPKSLRHIDGKTLAEYTGYGQAAGTFIGAAIGALLADILGRRKPMFCYFVMMLVFHTLSGIAVSWQIFIFLRILVGICAGGLLSVSTVMSVEFAGKDWRDACMCSGMWTLGVVFISLESLVTMNWRYLAFVSGALGFPLAGTYYLIPESARWLLCKHRFQDAEAGIKEMISCNRRAVPNVTALLDKARSSVVCHMHQKKYTYLDLCHSINFTKWTVALVYVCLVGTTVYFCLTERVLHITGNIYVNGFLPHLLDLPLTWTVIIVNKCLGRRWCLFLYAVASGFSLLSVIVLHMTGNLQQVPNMIIGLALFGKLGVTASLSLIAVITIEMYPTVIRCMGASIAVLSGAGGAVLSKQLRFLDEYHYTVPFLVYGGLMVSVGFTGLLLPETIGKPLPNILPCKHRKIPLPEGARLVTNPWDAL